MCKFLKLGHECPKPSTNETRSVQSLLCCVKHSESSLILGQFMTDFEREQRSDSQRTSRLEELRLIKPRLEQPPIFRDERECFSETSRLSSSPVILLTALSAMVISRVSKLEQENARHDSIVASTSLCM